MKSLRTWAVLGGMAALLVASGCETTGGQTQTTIYDIHQRMVKLDKELGSSITQLNEGTATLNARLDASGKVALVARGQFALQGRLQNFDPSRFARLPAARLNAELDAQGSSSPQLALALRFQLKNSRLGGEALDGKGKIDLVGQRLRKADV